MEFVSETLDERSARRLKSIPCRFRGAPDRVSVSPCCDDRYRATCHSGPQMPASITSLRDRSRSTNRDGTMNIFTGVTSRVLVPLAILLAGCSSTSPSPTAPSSTTRITPIIADGSWVVSSLLQRTEDKTSQFSGYTLKFISTAAESGTVTATRNGSTTSGTWSHSPAVTYYGSTSQEAIVLNLGTSTPFDRLSGTWNVVSSTNASLELVSPEVAEDSHLVLAKQ